MGDLCVALNPAIGHYGFSVRASAALGFPVLTFSAVWVRSFQDLILGVFSSINATLLERTDCSE